MIVPHVTGDRVFGDTFLLFIGDGNRSRSNYPQKSNGSYGNRNNYVRNDGNSYSISLEEIFDESQCKKIVENARKQFVSEYNDMDDTVTIVNDKLVYVRFLFFCFTYQSISGILHIVQSIDFDKEEYSSPYQYTLFNKKLLLSLSLYYY